MSERVSTYEGDKLKITYDRGLCIHASECGRASNDLFNVKNEPWCSPNSVPADVAVDVVERCPTGALTYERLDGGPVEATPDKNTVMVVPNGPLYVRGQLEVEGMNGQGIPTRVALCRCGASSNKPFCDNSHKTSGFKDAGPVGERGEPLEARDGLLQIKSAPNGPLLLSGNVAIHAASGREAWTGTKTALCRCGQSGNKPFCDGSHKAAGFAAE